MPNDYLVLALGVVCAAIGGELFVRATVGLARWARVSPGIIGATVAAFATSSPELAVSVSSAIAGEPQLALGDALGANVLNLALIFGLASIISRTKTTRDCLWRDFPVALLVPVLSGVLFLDGVVSRIDGLVMLGMFLAWLTLAVVEARRQRSAAERLLGERRVWLAIVLGLVGIALLVIAGHLIVTGARSIALSFGIGEFVVGATIVAIGTTMPELATTVIAKLRGHDEIGLGTLLGSNIFNGLFIVSVAAVITPIRVDWREAAVALTFGALAVAFTFPNRSGFIERRRGVLLLMLYVAYLSALLQRHG